MSEINITVEGGASKRLLTAGKYCDRDIVVTAEGGNGGSCDCEKNVCAEMNPTKDNYLETTNFAPFTFAHAQTIGERAFVEYNYLTKIDLPKVVTIGDYAFNGCAGLTDVDSPAATTIGVDSFGWCEKLVNISIPQVSSIRMLALRGCTFLSTIDASMVTSIDYGAFRDCHMLAKIDLPKCTNIGATAFENCMNLKSIILRTTETVCVADTSAFYNTPMMTGEGHIYVPAVMYEYYRAGYEPVLNGMMPGFFDILFRKIEDYTVDGTIMGDLDETKI